MIQRNKFVSSTLRLLAVLFGVASIFYAIAAPIFGWEENDLHFIFHVLAFGAPGAYLIYYGATGRAFLKQDITNFSASSND